MFYVGIFSLCDKQRIKVKLILPYRPTWGEGEFMWKKDDVLVHNTPYWGGETINQYIGGYPHVCEKRDMKASDWILTKISD